MQSGMVIIIQHRIKVIARCECFLTKGRPICAGPEL
jgi:hypothetical protein